MNSWDVPDLTLEMMKSQYISQNDYCPRHIIEVLENEQYTDLGWLNSGTVKLPKGVEFIRLYKDYSGSYTIMVNHQFRMYYCVDMGD